MLRQITSNLVITNERVSKMEHSIIIENTSTTVLAPELWEDIVKVFEHYSYDSISATHSSIININVDELHYKQLPVNISQEQADYISKLFQLFLTDCIICYGYQTKIDHGIDRTRSDYNEIVKSKRRNLTSLISKFTFITLDTIFILYNYCVLLLTTYSSEGAFTITTYERKYRRASQC
jgi:hypothetical protein